jgi:hypothetical protein
VPDANQAAGIFEGQCLQKHAIHYTEDGSVRADSQRKSDHRDSRECRSFANLAKRVS